MALDSTAGRGGLEWRELWAIGEVLEVPLTNPDEPKLIPLLFVMCVFFDHKVITFTR